MKTMLETIVYWITAGIAIVEAIPVAIIARIISLIKSESDEMYYRRCYRLMRWYFGSITEDDFVYNYCSSKHETTK